MRAIRRRLRPFVWWALFSMAALAVCPTVSRMCLPGLATEPRISHGHHHVHEHAGAMLADAMPEPSQLPAHHHALEHCGFCVLAGHAYAVAPAPVAAVALLDGRPRAHGTTALSLPRLRSDWSPANPRGPPTVPA
jgi:hypothetical protein